MFDDGNQDAEKQVAARRAVAEVQDGMLVGLGSGSTAVFVIRELGKRVAAGLKIRGVATSLASAALAVSHGIELLDGGQVPRLDIAIDGADEIDAMRRAIKGGGGALLREKIVAAAADRMIAVVDSSKFVDRLGRFPLPIEVLPFAAAWVARCIEELGGNAKLRLVDGKPFTTDQGNHIFDIPFGAIEDPEGLANTLQQIPGVLEHGLFLREIDVVMIGRGGGVELIS